MIINTSLVKIYEQLQDYLVKLMQHYKYYTGTANKFNQLFIQIQAYTIFPRFNFKTCVNSNIYSALKLVNKQIKKIL